VTEPPHGAWFGAPWPSEELRAPVCEDDTLRVPTPIGWLCALCDERIASVDRGTFIYAVSDDRPGRVQPVHVECSYRSVMGGIGHQKRTCTCFGGKDDPDMGLTRRQSALEVWRLFNA